MQLEHLFACVVDLTIITDRSSGHAAIFQRRCCGAVVARDMVRAGEAFRVSGDFRFAQLAKRFIPAFERAGFEVVRIVAPHHTWVNVPARVHVERLDACAAGKSFSATRFFQRLI